MFTSPTMADGPQVSINRIYLKDLSFESPMTPDLFEKGFSPEVKIDFGIQSRSLKSNLYEITLELTVTGKMEGETAFIVEVEQAGVFTLEGLTEAQLPQATHIFCPNVLFPYARQSIDSAMNQGGLPSLMLAPVNFEAIYQQNAQAGAGSSA